MEPIDDRLQKMPCNKPLLLNNQTCVYCGCNLTKANRTKEHVISRRFVPKGMLNQQWNLIAYACECCNRKKARLEDVVSAITMQPNASGEYAESNETLAQEALRKGKGSISPKTKKPIVDSSNSFNMKFGLGNGITISAKLVSPPSLDEEIAVELASMHCMAFFYLSTYNEEEAVGRFWVGGFTLVQMVSKSDWGNERVISFCDRVSNWKTLVIGHAANGFFRVVIRRDPDRLLWSYALEWNMNYRIVGFFGDCDCIDDIVDEIPKLEVRSIKGQDGAVYRLRPERRLTEDQDSLFDCREWDS